MTSWKRPSVDAVVSTSSTTVFFLLFYDWWYVEEGFCGLVDSAGYQRVIHCVKMNTLNAVSYEVYNLVYGVSNSCISDSLRVVAIALHHICEFFWQYSVCHADHAFDRLFVGSWHNSSFDWNINSLYLTAF